MSRIVARAATVLPADHRHPRAGTVARHRLDHARILDEVG
jgi:hypothetical protein